MVGQTSLDNLDNGHSFLDYLLDNFRNFYLPLIYPDAPCSAQLSLAIKSTSIAIDLRLKEQHVIITQRVNRTRETTQRDNLITRKTKASP